MEPTTSPSATEGAAPTGSTRRMFIRGIAAAGASTVATVALERAGVLDLEAAGGPAGLPQRRLALHGDRRVARGPRRGPEGYRGSYGDNSDFLAFFPLGRRRRIREGLLVVNHEYPSPFLQHGTNDPAAKTWSRSRRPESLTSFWPEGIATRGQDPAVPRPAAVAITKVRRRGAPRSRLLPVPEGGR